jgi:tetratricopeptide (TPR) repeat protein
MGEQKLERKVKHKELIRAERLIDDGQLNSALQILNAFEEKKENTLYDIISCKLIRCELFFQQGLYDNMIKFSEQTFKQSLKLVNSILSVDSLIKMAYALIFCNFLDKGIETIKKGEELLKSLKSISQKERELREASFAFLKGRRHLHKEEVDQAIEYFNISLNLYKNLDAGPELVLVLSNLAWMLSVYKGELDLGLKYGEQSVTLAKTNAKKYYIASSLGILANFYEMKGDSTKAVRLSEQSLALYKKFNNKIRMAMLLNNMSFSYKTRGELDHALECIDLSLALYQEIGALLLMAINQDSLIRILIEMGDLERAQKSLRDMEKLKNKLKNKTLNLWYIFDKALILKNSSRSIKRGKAEEIFKQLLEDKDLSYEIKTELLLNLCELLLMKLRDTNNLVVLDEILIYVNRIMNIAKSSHSYWLLAEVYLLQAKLKLITLEFEEAPLLLSQAGLIVEKYGLNLLAKRISEEQEELSKKLNHWEELKQTQANFATRIELAGLEEQIRRLLKKRMNLRKLK